MLIRVALWLFLLCLPLFILAKTLLMFTFFVIATFAMQGATFLLFVAFGLFIFSGLIFIIKNVWSVFRQYFSTEQRAQRHILFVKNQKNTQQRLFHFQRLQLDYFKERQRKKILEQNNQKQIDALSKSIDRELQRIKSQLSNDYFSQLELENHRYRVQQNETALLKLHQKIATIAGK